MTRVVAGRLGGRNLRVPRGTTTRPTTDRVREALFSTLGDRVVGAKVLDLFAGSGALGIEALSRGAEHATFVERDRRAVRVLRENLTELGLRARVHAFDVGRFVRDLDGIEPSAAYDLVLCDPPYRLAAPEVLELLSRLSRDRHLARGAMMVVERDRHGGRLTVAGGGLAVVDVRTYGDTVLYYLRRDDGDEGHDPHNQR